MKIYTKTGDGGETALFGGGRVSKADRRVEAYGAVDELNAVLGWALARIAEPGVEGTAELASRLRPLQSDLFTLGAHLATPGREGRRTPELPPLPASRIDEIEDWLDALHDELPPLKAFILPGGAPGAAALHLARTVCRRAERRVVALAADEAVDDVVLVYLNRLSDLFFQLARAVNRQAGVADVEWSARGAAEGGRDGS